MAHKLHQTIEKIALVLSSGAVGYLLAHIRREGEVSDWQQIAADATQTSAKAIALTQERAERERDQPED